MPGAPAGPGGPKQRRDKNQTELEQKWKILHLEVRIVESHHLRGNTESIVFN